jgi:hypothetical protein
MHLQSYNTYFWRHCIGLTELLVFNCMLCMRRPGIAAVKQTADHSKIPTQRAAPGGSGHQVVPPWPPRAGTAAARPVPQTDDYATRTPGGFTDPASGARVLKSQASFVFEHNR